MNPTRYIAIFGPTASGKSALALKLSEELHGEIINCDSVQFYRGCDIGAAKASAEEQSRVPHHLIDCLDLAEEFDAGTFAKKARAFIADCNERSKIPFVVGGSGLYLRALWGSSFHDLPKDDTLRRALNLLSDAELLRALKLRDPQRASELHPNDRYRLKRALEIAILSGKTFASLSAEDLPQSFAPSFSIMLNPPRENLKAIIAKRCELMLAAGFIAEVESLVAKNGSTAKALQSVGYKEVLAVLNGTMPEASLATEIATATWRLAKRQLTWFSKTPRDLCLQEIPADCSNIVANIKKRLEAAS